MSDLTLLHGDCVERMYSLPEASIHAIVCDPPYGLEFMGKAWDSLGGGRTSKPGIGERNTEWVNSRGWNTRRCSKCGHLPHGGSPCQCDEPDIVLDLSRWRMMQDWHESWAHEALRVLRPGGYMLAFSGTRTYHRLACAVEDVGFDVRDCLSWLYATGFPKAHDAAAQVDRFLGVQRTELLGHKNSGLDQTTDNTGVFVKNDGNAKWTNSRDETGLIPVYAPASEEAKAWDGWHTALKPAFEPILLAQKPRSGTIGSNLLKYGVGALNIDGCRIEGVKDVPASPRRTEHDGFLGKSMANQTGDTSGWDPNIGRWPSNVLLDEEAATMLADESRFFYVAKPSAAEKNAGLNGSRTTHPTVKPVDLMRYLVRLVTPKLGTVLDPFLGSGTTGIAALLEGVNFIGIEREAEYLHIAEQRIAFWREHGEHGLEIVREREAAVARREALEAAGQMSLLG